MNSHEVHTYWVQKLIILVSMYFQAALLKYVTNCQNKIFTNCFFKITYVRGTKITNFAQPVYVALCRL
jgi:hypothetical protein